MKAFRVITALLIATMMIVPAAAAGFVPSREQYQPGVVEKIDPDTGDEYIGKIVDEDDIVIEYLDEKEIIIEFDKENEEILNNEPKDVVENFEEEWKEATGGAPVDNTGITNIFEVTIPEEVAGKVEDDHTVEIHITVDELTKDDKFVIVQNDGEKWTVVDHTIDDNGVITIVIDNVDPEKENQFTYAIILDTTEEPTPGDDSPQTGVASYSIGVIASTVVLCGVAFVVIRKASKGRTAA